MLLRCLRVHVQGGGRSWVSNRLSYPPLPLAFKSSEELYLSSKLLLKGTRLDVCRC